MSDSAQPPDRSHRDFHDYMAEEYGRCAFIDNAPRVVPTECRGHETAWLRGYDEEKSHA